MREKKVSIGAQEHKDNFATENSDTDINNHKDTFKATLASIEERKITESDSSQHTSRIEKPITPIGAEFRVTKEDYDKVLADLLRVRPSRTEQEKALNEQALREKQCLRAEEQAAIEEKRRRKIEKKRMSRERKLLRLVQRTDGVPRQIAQKLVAEMTEEQKEMDIEHTLETYDQYVHQNYYDPDTDELMEIINVYCDKETGAYMSTARVMNYDLGEPDFEIRTKRINGPDGTKYLVNLATTGRHGKNDLKWPQSAEEWVQLQLKDAWCKEMIDRITTDTIKIPINQGLTKDYYYRTRLEDKTMGPLYRNTHYTQKTKHLETEVHVQRFKEQIIVPRSLVATCMHMMHDQMGHPGRDRTLDTTRLSYNWLGINDDIHRHVQNCRFCKLRKVDTFRAKVPIQSYNRMSRPFDRVHADLAGPFQVTDDGYKYILIIKDALTKYVILVPLHDKTAEEVAKGFTDKLLAPFGPPKVLITDKGTDFVNKQLKRWCNVLGVEKKHTTPVNPRADGLAENAVKTVKDMLASFINAFQTDWDKYLPIISYDYNTTVNAATGYDPYFLLFGRTANRKGETIDHADAESLNIDEYAERFAEVMKWVWENIGQRVGDNSKEMAEKQHPRTYREFKEYNVGDFFYSKRVPKRFHKDEKDEMLYKLNAKLQNRWTGPYIIVKKISPVLYEADVHNQKKVVHAVNMRPY
jgi:transposase InsO family protein